MIYLNVLVCFLLNLSLQQVEILGDPSVTNEATNLVNSINSITRDLNTTIRLTSLGKEFEVFVQHIKEPARLILQLYEKW